MCASACVNACAHSRVCAYVLMCIYVCMCTFMLSCFFVCESICLHLSIYWSICLCSAGCSVSHPYYHGLQHRDICHQHHCCIDAGWRERRLWTVGVCVGERSRVNNVYVCMCECILHETMGLIYQAKCTKDMYRELFRHTQTPSTKMRQWKQMACIFLCFK